MRAISSYQVYQAYHAHHDRSWSARIAQSAQLALLVLLTLVVFNPSVSLADDEDDDILGEDFGTSEESASAPVITPVAPKLIPGLRISGAARSQWAVWTLRPPKDMWAKGRQVLDLNAEYQRDAWRLNLEGHVEYDLLYLSEGPFDPTQVEAYERRYIPGIQRISRSFNFTTSTLTLSTGRDVVTWGELDGLSALDVVNPQDQREPGVTELDDMRIAVWLTRLTFAQGPHELELMVRHEGNYGILIPPRADYSPFNALLTAQPGAEMILGSREVRFGHEREGVGADTQSYFARYLYRGAGLDLGLYAASLLYTQGVISEIKNLLNLEKPVTLMYDHPRYSLWGATTAIPLGSTLIKAELAGAIDQPTNVNNPGDPLNPFATYLTDTLTAGLGVTYNGISDTTLSAEYQRSFLLSDEPEAGFLFPPDIGILALRASVKLLKEKLEVSGVISLIEPRLRALHKPERGGIARLDLKYQVRDQLSASLGYARYLTSDKFGPFYGLEQHDRLFTQISWSFRAY